ncbi:hypothetical protein COE50_29535 [Bacillus anthracis]|nr:hypothetical protein COE50_29535 [Bacillus anthracis]
MDSISLAECIRKLELTDMRTIISFLEAQKKHGFIFYREDLATISQNTQFDVYFSETRGFIKNNDAFPIPIALYYYLKIDSWSLKWLNTFYRLYYKDVPLSPIWREHWDFHISERFAWVYKKTL